MNDKPGARADVVEVVPLKDGTMVDVRTLQNIYHELTGKSEKLTKMLRGRHILTFDDVSQLVTKIHQASQHYNVKSYNCSVTVYFANDTRVILSSIDQFKIFDTSSSSATETVSIEYSFMHIPPGGSKVQSYKIEVDLGSQAAKRFKAASAHGIEAHLLQLASQISGQIDIDYIDYSIAKFLMSVVEEWYTGVKKTRDSIVLRALKSIEDWHATIFKVFGVSIAAFVFWLQKNTLFPIGAAANDLAISAVFCFVSFVIIYSVSSRLGASFGNSVDLMNPVSALMFNKGDAEVVERYKKSDAVLLLKSALFIVSQIAISILASWLAIKLKIVGV